MSDDKQDELIEKGRTSHVEEGLTHGAGSGAGSFVPSVDNSPSPSHQPDAGEEK
jgi:hypothetical protein